jgi:hypothetical protein
VNRTELNWLLQTIEDADTAERFVLARYQHGRISFQMMGDVAREQGWINTTAKEFANTTTRHSNEYATAELAVANA